MGKYLRISSYIKKPFLINDCNCSTLNLLIYEKNLIFFFISGIANHYMKGKYVYIFTLRRIKIFKLARKDTADRVQLRTRDDSAQSSSYNRSILEQNSSEETERNSQAQNMIFQQKRLKNLQKIPT
jgi:hypothetical protein